MKLEGIGVSPGVALGPALVLERRDFTVGRRRAADSAAEIERFQEAVRRSREEILGVRRRAQERLGERFTHLFDAHLLILDDRSFIDDTLTLIRERGQSAEWALKQVADRLLEVFASLEDPYLSDRGGDLEDVYRRVQGHLMGRRSHHDLSDLAEDAIIVARSLSPSDTALLNTDRVIGFVTEAGGRTSHTAIIANALEIPAVIGVHGAAERVRTGDILVVDGGHGVVLLNPSASDLERAQAERRAYQERERDYLQTRDVPAITTDGVEIALRANIELPEEVETALHYGAAGIGLYRSEFLFLNRSPALPTEEEHLEVYGALADRVSPHPCVIRTLDLGGEKYFHEVLDRNEANPVMGMRAIRFCLKRRDIFRTQLRGALRAAVGRRVALMFPLISGVEELRQARAVLEETASELRHEGVEVPQTLPVGAMIEVPSAALIADLVAREVDFFSVGTNDLIQYTLAIDRGNESVSYLYQPFHPAILRLLKFVIDSASVAGIGVSVCGEMASDPTCVPLLVGLGLRELSLNPLTLPVVKHAIRGVNRERAEALTRQALGATTAAEVAEILRSEAGSGAVPSPREA